MAANSTTVTAPGTISPKVYWPMFVGLVLTFLASFLAAVTPDMLGALGPFAVPMALALGAVAQAVTGYMKGDELRDIGVGATAAVLPAPPTPLPAELGALPLGSTAVGDTDLVGGLRNELAAQDRAAYPQGDAEEIKEV